MLETNKRQQRRVYIYIEQKMRKKMRKKMIEKSCFWGRGINFSLSPFPLPLFFSFYIGKKEVELATVSMLLL